MDVLGDILNAPPKIIPRGRTKVSVIKIKQDYNGTYFMGEVSTIMHPTKSRIY